MLRIRFSTPLANASELNGCTGSPSRRRWATTVRPEILLMNRFRCTIQNCILQRHELSRDTGRPVKQCTQCALPTSTSPMDDIIYYRAVMRTAMNSESESSISPDPSRALTCKSTRRNASIPAASIDQVPLLPECRHYVFHHPRRLAQPAVTR